MGFCDPKTTVDPEPPQEDGMVVMDTDAYSPPRVWTFDETLGKAPSANRPTAGPRFEKELPVGKHGLQLYSMATPNGQKVAIFLEELLAAGVKEAEYDAWKIDITKGDQFGSDYVNNINPNSKIPGLLDYTKVKKQANKSTSAVVIKPIQVFESNSILLYLAEKFQGKHAFIPKAGTPNQQQLRADVINWMIWQSSSAPFLGGGLGHFFVMAKEKQEYPINRFTTEVKRQLDVLNHQLGKHRYICGNTYTMADIAIFTWHGQVVLDGLYNPTVKVFLNAEKAYPNVVRWAKLIQKRPAVVRGLCVNRTWGSLKPQLKERHSAEDIDKALAAFRSQKKTNVSLCKLDTLTSDAFSNKKPPTHWTDTVLLVPHEWLRHEMAEAEVSIAVLPEKLGWGDLWKAVYFCQWIVDYFAKVVLLHHQNEEVIYFPFMLDNGCKIPEEKTAADHVTLMAELAAIESLAAAVVKDEGWWSTDRIKELKVKIPAFVKNMKAHLKEEEEFIPKALKEAGISVEQNAQCMQKLYQAGGIFGLHAELPGVLVSLKIWASDEFYKDFVANEIPPPLLALAKDIFIPNYKTKFQAMRDAPTMEEKPELTEVPFDPSMLPPPPP
mmetsp:Transcript_24812/g.68701  ORF Transcript_24812/g.68701 Transcript_24812/m.68701 type:complete len:608 (-) Transcript_24812:121-1944(-)